jgi:hypothetical protein
MTTDEDFDAIRCIVTFARGRNHCRLAQVKTHALAEGFSQESIDRAVIHWAEYEARKRERR